MAKFAQELVDEVIDYFADDPRSLIAFSLVARNWEPRSRWHLFSEIDIGTSAPSPRSRRFIDPKKLSMIFLSSPYLAYHVRVVQIRVSKAIIGKGDYNPVWIALRFVLSRVYCVRKLTLHHHFPVMNTHQFADQWEELSALLRGLPMLTHLTMSGQMPISLEGLPPLQCLSVNRGFYERGVHTPVNLHGSRRLHARELHIHEIADYHGMSEPKSFFGPNSPINFSYLRMLSLSVNCIAANGFSTKLIKLVSPTLEVLRLSVVFIDVDASNPFVLPYPLTRLHTLDLQTHRGPSQQQHHITEAQTSIDWFAWILSTLNATNAEELSTIKLALGTNDSSGQVGEAQTKLDWRGLNGAVRRIAAFGKLREVKLSVMPGDCIFIKPSFSDGIHGKNWIESVGSVPFTGEAMG